MSSALVLTNLRIDAAFYQLDGRFEKCDALMAREPGEKKLQTQKHYLAVGCEYGHSDEASFEEQMERASKAFIWSTLARKECSVESRLVGWHIKSSSTEEADYILSKLMTVLAEVSCIKAS